jgi:hypothetical protein
MGLQDAIGILISKAGRTVTILRNAGNITDKCHINPSRGQAIQVLEYQRLAYFAWDSQIISGDIFRDELNLEIFLVVSAQYVGHEATKDYKKLLVFKTNDQATLYKAMPSVASGHFGDKEFPFNVVTTDYVLVASLVKDDTLTPIGEIGLTDISVIFSKRNMIGYVPKLGDRIVTSDQRKWQVNAVDSFLYPNCVNMLCSLDQRMA